jgi:hypothetical protein
VRVAGDVVRLAEGEIELEPDREGGRGGRARRQ